MEAIDDVLPSIDGVSIAEPWCYLSAAQAAWCERSSLAAVVPRLPCWVPQRAVSVALFGAGGARLVDAATAMHGPWVWATELSNVHATLAFEEPGFVLDGVRYAGPEEYFQLAKSEGMPDHAAAVAAMARGGGPMEAWRVGQRHGLRPDWEAAKLGVMREAVRAKFTQSRELGELLRATGEHPLVQLKERDAYWGTGPDGRGRNALGGLLMELRAELRAELRR